MTFLEAAIEILRHEGEGLHFSEIARRAVEKKLLSHVGRDPEAAMRSCLTSAVRSDAADGLLSRAKPGVYKIRPGAKLPDPPPAPAPAAAPTASPGEGARATKKASRSKKKARVAKVNLEENEEQAGSEDPPKRAAKKATKKATKRTSKRTSRSRQDPAAAEARDESPETSTATAAEADAPAEAEAPVPELSFEAPSGSGLDGVTDVAVVMANAMSRLADERPELREELEAMQSRDESEEDEFAEAEPSSGQRGAAGRARHERRPRGGRSSEAPVVSTRREPREKRPVRDDPAADRGPGGRRRRRRRRRGRRVDWGDTQVPSTGESCGEDLLDRVAAVLDEAGPRALHVRQIAETLASQGILGGEISEIERAVTASLLADVRRRGRASRFSIRGDARYQLQSSRMPEPARKAEKALHAAIRETEVQTREQLLAWLRSLGARALEAIVRIYLDEEGYRIHGTLALSRGLGKMIVEDPEAEEGEARTLVLVAPTKTALEPRLWEGEVERHACAATLVFAMGEPPEENTGDVRMIHALDLAQWMLREGVGVETVKFEVPVLDAALIESVGGLDT